MAALNVPEDKPTKATGSLAWYGLRLSAAPGCVTSGSDSLKTVSSHMDVTVNQLRGLHGRVHLGGWRRDDHCKGSVNVLGDFPNLT